ncbi:MAG TPA: IS4 family transposase [Kofleriaceae bacterium]|nr:IS4 family transposase [Kofleriaceae bacterium]
MLDFDETLTEALEFTAGFTPEAFPRLVKHLDPVWVEEALEATGTATLRRRRLPADRTVWLVLAMALMRDWPITEVAEQLELALPGLDGSRTVARSALPQARSRLGADPMEWLFLRTADEWGHASADRDRWRGLALYAVDGTTLRVADSAENRAHFGDQFAGGEHGVSGYPLMRVVVLMAVRSHLLAAASFGPYSIDERRYAESLWESVPDRSLVLIDRNYLQANVLVPIMTKGSERHWITRATARTTFRSIRRLGPGDELVEMEVSQEARRQDPSLPKYFDVRAIRYERKGYQPQLLLTSLVDEKRYPADELRTLYHERWEVELGFGEIKTDMLERLETIRSKSPSSVTQETWGVLIAYNLVRLEMERIADELRVPPTRISFLAALRFFVEQWRWAAMTKTPGAIPTRLTSMRDRVRRFVLPPRRPERVYPRAVKLKMSNYGRSRPSTGKAAK